MLYRPIRRYLDESMLEKKEFTTLEELKALLPEEGEIEFKDQGYDGRCGWHSHLVSVNGRAAGHTDGVPFDLEGSTLIRKEVN